MSQWNLYVPGVSTVLTNVSAELGVDEAGGGLSECVDRTSQKIESALEAAGSGPVESELLRFTGAYNGATGEMLLRGLSCVIGAGEATRAYMDGNEEMALEAQNNAGTMENLDLGGDEPGGPR
ncbi:DUF6507 family protein [Nocardiopsis sp. EMB25]|uniref:DUF6507 family protein n=1 Tax=Nocardiopsis sp. EMB25 TaxID=2835867 RepID=UPI0022837102|nr:DUF6507 family protein [Nocardiopsis sp. EMB25]MCY9784114.1 DUF6507 family protein [Nocardiopsis sp. EMB25]